jgi:hypothetical protein
MSVKANGPEAVRQTPIAAIVQLEQERKPASAELPPFFSIRDLAERWRCSRGSVYNRIRGQKVVDFAAKGRKGRKLEPLDVVLRIEKVHLRVLR